MTEQEVKVLAVRLGRIWIREPRQRLGKFKFTNPCPLPRETLWRFNAKRQLLHIRIHITPTIFLDVDNSYSRDTLYFGLTQFTQGFSGLMSCNSQHGRVHLNNRNWARELTAEWLPTFRRGCWLSGCPIEASAHEKAEWIQGFSREEIEAWNLKM